MSCYSCNVKFSILQKEKSCGICRLSFCTNCLKKGNTQELPTNLCYLCLKNLNKQQVVDPPAILLQRLESLDNPHKPPVTIIQNASKYSNLKVGLTEKDLELIERLEKLKEKDGPPIPTVEEIKQRLAALKGLENTEPETSRPTSFSKVPLTDAEQVDALLMEYMEEAGIGGVDDIDRKMNESKIEDSSSDEESAVSKVLQRAVDEAALPRTGELTPPEPVEEELPWCELCNEDAALRCLTCDGALYCRRCLKESHETFDLKDHKIVAFRH